MILSPLQQYQQDLKNPNFQTDQNQAEAINILQTIYQKLIQRKNIWEKIFKSKKKIKGCYLWGPVGSGKSYLMNTFFHCLPFKQKIRLHFHEFMQRIHNELTILQGHKNPLRIIAKRWAKQTKVICFDEFFVKDIADAMLLGNLLEALFIEGICLIATSNVKIENLYQNGLQRQRFLPAINVLQQFVEELEVDNHIDYRLQNIKPAGVYFTPLNEQAEQKMMQYFHYYAKDDVSCHDSLMINKRLLEPVRRAEKIVWFDFATLCETALGSDDYLAIAHRFLIVMLSNVPIIETKNPNIIVRFINLIDVFYDNHIQLIISAASTISNLYHGEKWLFEFQRTKSRLLEMQSENYLLETRSQ